MDLYLAPAMLTCYDGPTNEIPVLDKRELARFWSKVERTPNCWLWTGRTNKDGYGIFSLKGKDYRAHRVAHQIAKGPTELRVRHRCNNPPCVNPAHLALGRQKANSLDMARSGHAPRRRLTEEMVLEIIRLEEQGGMSASPIAKRLGLNQSTVRNVLTGRTWSWLTGRSDGVTESPDITPDLAAEVRRLRAERKTYREISFQTGIHPQVVGDICRRRSHNY